MSAAITRPGAAAGHVPMAVALAAGVAVVVAGAGVRPLSEPFDYTSAGTRSAAEFIDRRASPDAVTIVHPIAWYNHASEPGVDIAIRDDDTNLTGFYPYPADDRTWLLFGEAALDGTVEQVAARVEGVSRVMVHQGIPGLDGSVNALLQTLGSLGFVESERASFGGSVIPVSVIVLERS